LANDQLPQLNILSGSVSCRFQQHGPHKLIYPTLLNAALKIAPRSPAASLNNVIVMTTVAHVMQRPAAAAAANAMDAAMTSHVLSSIRRRHATRGTSEPTSVDIVVDDSTLRPADASLHCDTSQRPSHGDGVQIWQALNTRFNWSPRADAAS
jgi:hypothetical protein